jgi:uncharacterized protein (TIGR02118 family)
VTHRLVVQYGRPTDPDAFDKHYREVHAPLAQKIPGLVSFTVGRPASLDGSEAPYLVAELDFESAEAMGAGMGTPEGSAAGADMANFASGGATMIHFDVEGTAA